MLLTTKASSSCATPCESGLINLNERGFVQIPPRCAAQRFRTAWLLSRAAACHPGSWAKLDLPDSSGRIPSTPSLTMRSGRRFTQKCTGEARRNVIPRALHRFFSRPRQNFEPAFDQELLWIAARALNPAILFPAAHTSAGRTHIFRGRRKGLRARPPDHNGGATHPVDSGKARDPRFGSEFCFPAFPSPAQGACGLHDGRKRTRKGAASGAAR